MEKVAWSPTQEKMFWEILFYSIQRLVSFSWAHFYSCCWRSCSRVALSQTSLEILVLPVSRVTCYLGGGGGGGTLKIPFYLALWYIPGTESFLEDSAVFPPAGGGEDNCYWEVSRSLILQDRASQTLMYIRITWRARRAWDNQKFSWDFDSVDETQESTFFNSHPKRPWLRWSTTPEEIWSWSLGLLVSERLPFIATVMPQIPSRYITHIDC